MPVAAASIWAELLGLLRRANSIMSLESANAFLGCLKQGQKDYVSRQGESAEEQPSIILKRPTHMYTIVGTSNDAAPVLRSLEVQRINWVCVRVIVSAKPAALLAARRN